MSTQVSLISDVGQPSERATGRLDRARFFIANELKRRSDQLVRAEQWVFVSGLFVIALVLRLVSLFSLRHISHLPGRQAGADGVEFEQLARALAEGRGYVRPNGMPTAFRAPGFPLFVSLIYRITHLSVSAATLSFPLIGAAVCLVAYLLAREVVSERVARLAALLGAFYFPAIYFCTIWLSEPLFMLSFALSLWLFLIYLRKSSYAFLVAAGLMFSWSVLVRPFAILMLPALLIIDFLHSRRRMFTVPILLVCSLAFTVPWAARNYHLYHAPVLATSSGAVFHGANNDTVLRVPQHWGGWVSSTHLPGRALIVAAPNEYLHDQVEWRLGVDWVKTHLIDLPVLEFLKLARFVLPQIDSWNKRFVALSILTTLPFLPLWIFGIREATRPGNRRAAWFVIHCGVAMALSTGLIFWGGPRFRDSVAPLLCIYAGLGLESLMARFGRSDAAQSCEAD